MNVTPSARRPTGGRAAVNSTWTAQRQTAESNGSAETGVCSERGHLSDSAPFIYQTKDTHTNTPAHQHAQLHASQSSSCHWKHQLLFFCFFREPCLASAWPPAEIVLENSVSTQHERPKDRWLSNNQISGLWCSRRLIIPQQLSSCQIRCQAVNVETKKWAKRGSSVQEQYFLHLNV